MSIINDFVTYVKQTWENRPSTKSPVSAGRLGHMEDGIKSNSDAIEKVAAAVLSTIVNDPDKIASMAALYAVNQTVAANAAAIAELNSNIIYEEVSATCGEIPSLGSKYDLSVDYTPPEGYKPIQVTVQVTAGCMATGYLNSDGILSAVIYNPTTVTRAPGIAWTILLKRIRV